MEVPEHLYNRGEIYNLSVSRGTLTEEERYKINEHIVQTIIMLEACRSRRISPASVSMPAPSRNPRWPWLSPSPDSRAAFGCPPASWRSPTSSKRSRRRIVPTRRPKPSPNRWRSWRIPGRRHYRSRSLFPVPAQRCLPRLRRALSGPRADRCRGDREVPLNPPVEPQGSPPRPESTPLAGQALEALRQGKTQAARALLEEALRHHPRDPALRHNLAEVCFAARGGGGGRSGCSRTCWPIIPASCPPTAPAFPAGAPPAGPRSP